MPPLAVPSDWVVPGSQQSADEEPAILSGLGISLLVAGWWVGPAVILVAFIVVALRKIGITRFGGITGDTLGACEQLGEMGVLVVVAAAAWGGWDPWWV